MKDLKKLLYLQLYQAEILINNSKKFSFSDQKKKAYLETLSNLFTAIRTSIDNGYDETTLFVKKSHLDFVFKSIEFLKDSTLNTLPFEVVSCLNRAMNDWIDAKNFIVVTSLQSNLYAFSYDIEYARNYTFYRSLEAEYQIEFKRKLVQINLPLALSRDYLCSVALYHELGHFVDKEHLFSRLAQAEFNSMRRRDRSKLYPYFPYMGSGDNQKKLGYHLGEYFCDLFAAQYVGDTLNYYLEYITTYSDTDTGMHPSTQNRSKVVDDFLAGRYNPVVNLIQKVLEQTVAKRLEIKYDEIDSTDFYRLIPYDIKNDRELHGIFNYGWKVWRSDFSLFNKHMEYDVHLDESAIYKIINNLMEKSIGNYFVTEAWEKGKNE